MHAGLKRIFFDAPRSRIMGVVNVTPDSFSGDGVLRNRELNSRAFVDEAISAALQMVVDGAEILDIGGESTRPGADPVAASDEIARVVPVIQALAGKTDLPISIDTSKAEVARAALDAGASMVNDVWGLLADRNLGPLIAERDVPIVLMDNRSQAAKFILDAQLGGQYLGAPSEDIVKDVTANLARRIAAAKDAGIDEARIIIDPGLGFGKTPAQSLALIGRLDALKALGRPILVGPSRKSFIGAVLDVPPSDRIEGTAAAVACAILRGASILRVHDVKTMTRVARMTDAILGR
jgi:dihydropteroate synthase